MQNKYVLVTGGAGYIGSHAIVQLYKAGYKAVVIDNLCNSSRESIERVKKIVNHDFPFYEVDLMDISGLKSVFEKHEFECVIHFAGLKAVGESVEKPLSYYRNNISGSINLLQVMKEFDCNSIIFSSSATVYGKPQYLPLDENHPTGNCTSPYGTTKHFIEHIIEDMSASNTEFKAILLRYFNPVGAHQSGKIGEDPFGPPNNLMPYLAQVAVGRRPYLQVFGNDYETRDGTGLRDYIHVVDLAEGHVTALKALKCGCKAYNLGTGSGYTVLEMIRAFERASEKEIEYKIVERRNGDVATVLADVSLSKKELEWEAKYNLNDMCKDLWNWQQNNPYGYNEISKVTNVNGC